MAHVNASTMKAILSDEDCPAGRGLAVQLREARWTLCPIDPLPEVEKDPEEIGPSIAPEGPPHALIVLGSTSDLDTPERVAELIAKARDQGVPRVVLISDVAVYGPITPGQPVIRETTPVWDPETASEEAKRALALEQVVAAAQGMEQVVLRVPLLHDRTDPKALVEIRERMQTGKGAATAFQRLHPKDFAEAVQAAAMRPDPVGQTFIIAEPMAISASVLDEELARLGRLLTDADATADRVRPAHPLVQPIYATDKARRILNTRPRRSLWQGLAECAQEVVFEMRRDGYLPSNRPKLPPLIDALETRSMPLAGKVCVVTGGATGTGRALTVTLSRCGAHVIVVDSDTAAAADLLTELETRPSCVPASFLEADLTNLDAMRRVAQDIQAAVPQVDALLHAVQAVYDDREVTADGFEKTFVANYLAPYQITAALMGAISAQGHIVLVGSETHKGSGLDFADLFMTRGYSPMDAFARAQFATQMFATSLAERLRGAGPKVLIVAPGLDPKPKKGGRAHDPFDLSRSNAPQQISPMMAASHMANLLVDPKVMGLNGVYMVQATLSQPDPATQNEAARARLWQVSEALLNLVDA